MTRRTEKLNSLLKQVISEVIRRDVRHPQINELLTVIKVDISTDLHYAKVYISVIGSQEIKIQTLTALQASAGFIAVQASKKVVMRYFPTLTFKMDDTVDSQMRIDTILNDLQKERESRTNLSCGFNSLRGNDYSEEDGVILLEGNSPSAISESKSAADSQKIVENKGDKLGNSGY